MAERVQALAASGLWEAVNLPALREKPAPKTEAKPMAAPSTGVGTRFCSKLRWPWIAYVLRSSGALCSLCMYQAAS